MSNLNGVTYYKLKSQFNGDVTKNCSLVASEVDGNFFFLRGYDIQDAYWDETDKILVLERVNKEKIIVDGILNSIDASNSRFDSETGILYLNIEGNEFPIEGFLTDDVLLSIDDIHDTTDELSKRIEEVDEKVEQILVDANPKLFKKIENTRSELLGIIDKNEKVTSEALNVLNDKISDVTNNLSDTTNKVNDNTNEISNINDILKMIEEYPGKPVLPSAYLTGFTDVVYKEVGENYKVSTDNIKVKYVNGQFMSKGSYNVTPNYIKQDYGLSCFITYKNNDIDFVMQDVFKVYDGSFDVNYNIPVVFQSPTNKPLTNLDRETTATSRTDTNNSAIWQNFQITPTGKTTVIGYYPCYINVDANNTICEDNPITKLQFNNDKTYEIVFPANKSQNGKKCQFFYPSNLYLESIMLKNENGFFFELNPMKYSINPFIIKDFSYNVLTLLSDDYNEKYIAKIILK